MPSYQAFFQPRAGAHVFGKKPWEHPRKCQSKEALVALQLSLPI